MKKKKLQRLKWGKTLEGVWEGTGSDRGRRNGFLGMSVSLWGPSADGNHTVI